MRHGGSGADRSRGGRQGRKLAQTLFYLHELDFRSNFSADTVMLKTFILFSITCFSVDNYFATKILCVDLMLCGSPFS